MSWNARSACQFGVRGGGPPKVERFRTEAPFRFVDKHVYEFVSGVGGGAGGGGGSGGCTCVRVSRRGGDLHVQLLSAVREQVHFCVVHACIRFCSVVNALPIERVIAVGHLFHTERVVWFRALGDGKQDRGLCCSCLNSQPGVVRKSYQLRVSKGQGAIPARDIPH